MHLDYDMVSSEGLNLIKLMSEAEGSNPYFKLKLNSDQSFVFSSLAQILVIIKFMDLGD